MKAIQRVCSFMACAAIMGCSSGRVSYYSLEPSPVAANFESEKGGIVVEVRHVRFPGYLNNPQMLTLKPTGEVLVDDRHRWIEDLGANFQRTFVQDLAASLQSSEVYVTGYSNRPASVIVQVDVVRFDQSSDGMANLTARWTVSKSTDGADGKSGVSVLDKPNVGDGQEARVAALSGLVASLADEVAAAVRQFGGARGRS